MADNGAGIALTDRIRIFELFFTGRRATAGTGLGLPIARSLLSVAGATIELIESTLGTAFLIRMQTASA